VIDEIIRKQEEARRNLCCVTVSFKQRLHHEKIYVAAKTIHEVPMVTSLTESAEIVSIHKISSDIIIK